MRLVFIFVASIGSVVNFRVRLEDVHCGSIEVIYCQAQQSNQKISDREKQKLHFWVGANHSVLWGYK